MDGKRVLVTGSSKGIGRAIALRLAKDGWSVAVHFAHDEKAANETAAALGHSCSGLYRMPLDGRDAAQELWRRALAGGPLQALVNNAGVYQRVDFAVDDDDEFAAAYEHAFSVNWESPLWLTREACKTFLAQGGGRVLNVASRVGHRGEAGASCYSTSKAALINLTRALAVEMAPRNVQHFAIAPGWVETAMARPDMDKRLPEIVRDIPVGRVASVEDCAATAAFLLSDEAAYLTGVVIDINGASYLR